MPTFITTYVTFQSVTIITARNGHPGSLDGRRTSAYKVSKRRLLLIFRAIFCISVHFFNIYRRISIYRNIQAVPDIRQFTFGYSDKFIRNGRGVVSPIYSLPGRSFCQRIDNAVIFLPFFKGDNRLVLFIKGDDSEVFHTVIHRT